MELNFLKTIKRVYKKEGGVTLLWFIWLYPLFFLCTCLLLESKVLFCNGEHTHAAVCSLLLCRTNRFAPCPSGIGVSSHLFLPRRPDLQSSTDVTKHFLSLPSVSHGLLPLGLAVLLSAAELYGGTMLSSFTFGHFTVASRHRSDRFWHQLLCT